MSSDPYTEKIFVLDALSHSLNISMFELITLLSSQAPLSNLLLVPALKLQQTPKSTLIPMPSTHMYNRMPIVPTAQGIPAAAEMCEPETDLYMEFVLLYWLSLAFVILVALLAIWTKLTMSVRKSLEERKPNLSMRPLTDVERWCMRRQKIRELEAERHDEKRA
jgi:hypothetical protein